MVAVSLKKFFFKQKTAYEIVARLVGSEMCIRDSTGTAILRDYHRANDFQVAAKVTDSGIIEAPATTIWPIRPIVDGKTLNLCLPGRRHLTWD